MKTALVRQNVSRLLAAMGISKAKFGEALGSKSKSIQARIDRANRFLKTQKSVSLDELNALSKFFGRPAAYFLSDGDDLTDSLLAEKHTHYGPLTPARIDAFSGVEIDGLIAEIQKAHPEILQGSPPNTLSDHAKRAILKAYYRK